MLQKTLHMTHKKNIREIFKLNLQTLFIYLTLYIFHYLIKCQPKSYASFMFRQTHNEITTTTTKKKFTCEQCSVKCGSRKENDIIGSDIRSGRFFFVS